MRETEGFCGNPPGIPVGPDIVSYLSVVTYDELFCFWGIYRPQFCELSIDPNRSYFVQPVALEVASNRRYGVKLAHCKRLDVRLRAATCESCRIAVPCRKQAGTIFVQETSEALDRRRDCRGRRNRKEHHV